MLKRLMILSFMLFARALLAQEEMPVIVDPPRATITVFTNWQEIQLTYTIRWLDGYEPLFEGADGVRPENMSFSEFELDPARGHKLELQNRRKYKKENYIDVVYYLRHIGEKKGDIPIPEQTFRYRKEETGKAREGQEVYDVKSPGIWLRYDSVLTKNADDIIDRVDFGSFKRQEYLWNGAIGGMAVIMCAILFLLFRNPVTLARKTGKTKSALAGQVIDEQEERLAPKYARVYLDNKLLRLRFELAGDPSDQILCDNTRNAICDELSKFFLSYVPELSEGEVRPAKIRTKISQIPEKRKREQLVILTNWLEEHEKILHGQKAESDLLKDIDTMREVVRNLDDWNIRLFNMRQKWQKLASLFSKMFRRVK